MGWDIKDAEPNRNGDPGNFSYHSANYFARNSGVGRDSNRKPNLIEHVSLEINASRYLDEHETISAFGTDTTANAVSPYIWRTTCGRR